MSEETNELRVQLATIDERGKSNTHRIDNIDIKLEKMDKKQDAVYKLASSVELLVLDMTHTKEDVKEIKDLQKDIQKEQTEIIQKITTVESEPAKKKAGFFDNIVQNIVMLVIGAVITYALVQIGL